MPDSIIPRGSVLGVADLHVVAEPAQMVGGRQPARTGTDDGHPLAGGGRGRVELPALLDPRVAEEPLDRMDGTALSRLPGYRRFRTGGNTPGRGSPGRDCWWSARATPAPGGPRWCAPARPGCSRPRDTPRCTAAAGRHRPVCAREPDRNAKHHATDQERRHVLQRSTARSPLTARSNSMSPPRSIARPEDGPRCGRLHYAQHARPEIGALDSVVGLFRAAQFSPVRHSAHRVAEMCSGSPTRADGRRRLAMWHAATAADIRLTPATRQSVKEDACPVTSTRAARVAGRCLPEGPDRWWSGIGGCWAITTRVVSIR